MAKYNESEPKNLLAGELEQLSGPEYWRGLEELADSPAFRAHLESEFPRFAALLDAPMMDRRSFLKLLGASMALAGAGCSGPPSEKILPYVDAPPELTPGHPAYYATAIPVDGYARGVLVETNEGRPTKVEGNPKHPASLGATDIYTQAAILQLWDPDRSRSVLEHGQPTTWSALAEQLAVLAARLREKGGEGLHILTGTVTSPSLAAELQGLASRYPKARWHSYEPVMRDNEVEGLRRAYGQALNVLYHFDKAQRVVSLDADFLGSGALQVRYARDFSRLRRAGEQQDKMNRLYSAEASPSLTGAMADHALAVKSGRVPALALALARHLGVGVSEPARSLDERERQWVFAAAEDLQRHGGSGLVLAGPSQPPEVHVLIYAINERLGNTGQTLSFTEPVAVGAQNAVESISELTTAMQGGRVDTLFILDANPAYDAPADLNFTDALKNTPRSLHCGLYVDETADACRWHVPLTHPLEQWGDCRAGEGTVSVQQPVIAPLYGGHSLFDVLAPFSERPGPETEHPVRQFWRKRLSGEQFDKRWHDILQQGTVPGSAAAAVQPQFVSTALEALQVPVETEGVELNFRPDPTVWDGRFSNNGWLQELPKPLTKLTWDNALLMSPASAAALGVADEQLVRLHYRSKSLEVPVLQVPGHAEGAVTLHLGYGRRSVGRVGEGRGFDAYYLRHSDAPWYDGGVRIEPTGARYKLANAQLHHAMEGRPLVRHATVETFRENPNFAADTGSAEKPLPSLYPEYAYNGYKWGMSVNLNTCTGCAACVVGCQAENNIPVVGKEQVRLGREMQWLRIDRYYQGAPEAPSTFFQPVPCMQCENAPCEPVCPVEASIHDHEGINVQVYNRCIGTRFCSNNCPYKVRRFNFLEYTKDEPALNARRNPEVTVRMRGVMEKCNYCLQRIANARIQAGIEDRNIRDGEVVTACEAACPTGAIVFGDLNDPGSRVVKEKSSPLDYSMLGELNTRPRTTYRAKLRNPNPKVKRS